VNRQDVWPLLLLVLLGAGSWGLATWLQQRELAAVKPSHAPDYEVDTLQFTTMGPDGTPRRRLVADRMVHYADDDSTQLTKPRLTLFEGDRPPWEVRSPKGWVSGDGELVLLQGEVHIDRAAAKDVRAVNIVTHDLRVQPKVSYAETDQPVDARSGADRVQAVGLQVWFDGPARLKLLSKVRGRYEVK
jgi:lipopolysaccharide export system protein LptC